MPRSSVQGSVVLKHGLLNYTKTKPRPRPQSAIARELKRANKESPLPRAAILLAMLVSDAVLLLLEVRRQWAVKLIHILRVGAFIAVGAAHLFALPQVARKETG